MRIGFPTRFASCLAVTLALGSLTGCVGAPGPAPTQVVVAPPGTQPAAGTAVVTAPPGAPYGATCYAGFYTCVLPASLPVGTPCTCPGIGAPSYGTVY